MCFLISNTITAEGDDKDNYNIPESTTGKLIVKQTGTDTDPIDPNPGDGDEGEDPIIKPGDGEGDNDGWKWDKDANQWTRVYDGDPHPFTSITVTYTDETAEGGTKTETLSGEDISITYSSDKTGSSSVSEIKNAATYYAHITINKEDAIISGKVEPIKLVIEPRPMNVNIKPLTAEDLKETEVAKVGATYEKFNAETNRGLVEAEEGYAGISGTMTITPKEESTEDEKSYTVTFSDLELANSGGDNPIFLASNYTPTFKYGDQEITTENSSIDITIGDITPGEDVEISDGDEDGDGNDWEWDATTNSYVVIYDGNGHGIETVTIKGNTYDVTSVSYTGDKLGKDALPTAAGYYTANVIVTIGEEEKSQTGTFPLYIKERPLGIHFDLDDLPEEYIGTNYAAADYAEYTDINGVGGRLESEAVVLNGYIKIASEPNEMGKYPVTFEDVALGSSETFNPDNYDEHFYLNGKEITLADGDGTFGGDTNPDQGIDIVEDDYISGSGTTTRYQLYLADKDFDKGTIYDEEGLELFSRHNKKYTKAGSSFTIWYEHNGVANDGEYRIFIRRGRSGDWTELKIDTVSDYYQIRNVQTDIYVKIYGLNGYPVANEEISATEARAYAQANKIVVITPEPTDVQIISMAGAVVATDKVTGQREFGNLTAGIYIVRMGETVVKLQVRN